MGNGKGGENIKVLNTVSHCILTGVAIPYWGSGKMIKIKDGEARPGGGCMCEPRSDILPNWNDIRTKFGYTMLGDIT